VTLARATADRRALGAAIRAARNEQGISQEALARRSGLDRSYCGAVERGVYNVTVDTLTTIAAGLDMRAGELLKRGETRDRRRRHT
jgi:transcriptional regulator with XRE-family HTH domain